MIDYKEMIKLAYEAQKNAYIPYSNWAVGACLVTRGGKVYLGCNIESATYTPTSCAERTAFFKAVSEGEREVAAIAIVGNDKNTPIGEGDYCPPCGVCRQVMAEFCDPVEFKIILAKSYDEYKEFRLIDLLPEIALPIRK
jgi:cytidine deaminase